MAQLWGGRFTGETDALVYRFNASIGFDKKLFGQDVEGSIAHVVMLEKQGIITCEEKDAIVKGLTQIRKDVEEGKLAITDQYEDIHSFVEAELIRRIGDAGKKMHTGRSRNDQVALDMKLYVRGEILELSDRLFIHCDFSQPLLTSVTGRHTHTQEHLPHCVTLPPAAAGSVSSLRAGQQRSWVTCSQYLFSSPGLLRD